MESKQKNFFFTDIIYEALLRLSSERGEFDKAILLAVKNEIISKQYLFEFIYKSYSNEELCANILIIPSKDKFRFYISILNNNVEKCRVLIYEGIPIDYYTADLFSIGK